MKLLIIPSWYPNKTNPLWGNYFIKQAEALTEYADVSFLNINRIGIKEINQIIKSKRTDGYYENKYKFKFIEKSILNVRCINLEWSYKRYQKAAYKAYKELIKHTSKPDAMLVECTLPAGLAALYISRKEGIPYIVHEHSYDTLVNPMYRDYSKLVITNSNFCMAVQDKIKHEIEKMGSACELIPNYIDTSKFNKISKKNHKFTLITICNFYKVKALEILLGSLRKVVYEKNITDIKLNIVGTGDYKNYYENLVKTMNLQEYVEFVGYVQNDEIPSYLSNSDVLCVSSKVETFCIPIIEAFAAGKPVLTTSCGGPDVLVDETRGIKVQVDNIEEYSEAIIKMKTTYKNYDSNYLKKYAHDNYDKEVICNKILDIIKNSI